jgi:hypothetical protein
MGKNGILFLLVKSKLLLFRICHLPGSENLDSLENDISWTLVERNLKKWYTSCLLAFGFIKWLCTLLTLNPVCFCLTPSWCHTVSWDLWFLGYHCLYCCVAYFLYYLTQQQQINCLGIKSSLIPLTTNHLYGSSTSLKSYVIHKIEGHFFI